MARKVFEAERTPAYPRQLAETLAICLQASLLTQFAPPPVAEWFIQTRVEGRRGQTLGTISMESTTAGKILDRAFPDAV